MSIAVEDLPCWKCQTPQGAAVRHFIGQAGELDETQRSPASGLPLACCRVRSMPLVGPESPSLSG
jgi:hypothetical protein